VKAVAPHVRTLLAVGGWNFGVARMTAMLRNASTRAEFIRSGAAFLRRRRFDGLDLDFEYPAGRGSPPDDRRRFAQLVEVDRSFDCVVVLRPPPTHTYTFNGPWAQFTKYLTIYRKIIVSLSYDRLTIVT